MITTWGRVHEYLDCLYLSVFSDMAKSEFWYEVLGVYPVDSQMVVRLPYLKQVRGLHEGNNNANDSFQILNKPYIHVIIPLTHKSTRAEYDGAQDDPGS